MASMKLRVSQEIYNERLERMSRLIEMKAPAVIIYHQARLIMKTQSISLRSRIKQWWVTTRVGYLISLWFDWEYIRYRVTGKSDIYGFESFAPEHLLELDEEYTQWSAERLKKLAAALAVTFLLPCGHPEESWYSICSAHHGNYRDENCPRCKVGRCIKCVPELPDGKLVFFNKEDGSPANPFPHLN